MPSFADGIVRGVSVKCLPYFLSLPAISIVGKGEEEEEEEGDDSSKLLVLHLISGGAHLSSTKVQHTVMKIPVFLIHMFTCRVPFHYLSVSIFSLLYFVIFSPFYGTLQR